MKSYEPPIRPSMGEILCDIVFLNPVPNEKCWFIKINKGIIDVILRLKYIYFQRQQLCIPVYYY